ncbi:PadR family transcriptional regulator [Desulfosporosinus youngiae]|uniref:Putative transcriptional regulator n=1 Tax=Desulfosporosinus youngiae DSM 17734 TaxID=768710 RepID=H5XV90_9FIRM|nr:PadR family transcriptional regulator [Desulfosporosinus youngiae]EHQ89688.1 putative transcriptional regulator [Desulfosporosinus youngiae DSM 17734]
MIEDMIENADCPCHGTNLEKLIHPAILTLLMAEELHGYSIVKKLPENCMLQGRKPDPSGVYRCLKSMEQQGYVTSVWNISNPGQAKRLYRITDDGIRCLQTWINTLEDYYRSLGLFLSFAKNAVLNNTADNNKEDHPH